MSEEEYWNYVKNELELDFSNEEIYKRLRESYEVNDKVEKLAKDLKAK
jgi:hypothetical protein